VNGGPAAVPGGRRVPVVGAAGRVKGAMGGEKHTPGNTEVGPCPVSSGIWENREF